MRKLLMRIKPGGSTTSHLFLAAALWTIIGSGLFIRGTLWLGAVEKSWITLPAIVLGCLKSLLILDKSARTSIERIRRLTDGSCLGGVYSLQTWALVVVMIMLGFLLRKLPVPLEIIGLIYTTVGWSLVLSSRLGWRAWLSNR